MVKVRNLGKRQLAKIIRKYERAIRGHCYECMGGQKRLDCEIETCPLYPLRPWAGKANKNDSKKDN